MNLKDHLINAVAAAAVLGGGSTIVLNKLDIARHDERISQVERLGTNIEGLRGELRETSRKLDRLDGRLEAERESR